MIGYDKHSINHNLLLGMTLEEMIGGNGAYIYDRAKPHHRMSLIDAGTGALTWGAVASGFPYLNFAPTIGAGIVNYVWLETSIAAAADLDFTTEDFTLLAWIYLANLARVHTVMCHGAQAVVNGGGYQLVISFSTPARLNFGTCQGVAVQTTTSMAEINAATWFLVGVTRVGQNALTFINGLDRTDAPDVHVDPAAQNEALYVGVRQIQTTGVGIDLDTPFEGYIAYPRIWGNKALSREEMFAIWEYERHWFGV